MVHSYKCAAVEGIRMSKKVVSSDFNSDFGKCHTDHVLTAELSAVCVWPSPEPSSVSSEPCGYMNAPTVRRWHWSLVNS